LHLAAPGLSLRAFGTPSAPSPLTIALHFQRGSGLGSVARDGRAHGWRLTAVRVQFYCSANRKPPTSECPRGKADPP
jgi:hypothetical protein